MQRIVRGTLLTTLVAALAVFVFAMPAGAQYSTQYTPPTTTTTVEVLGVVVTQPPPAATVTSAFTGSNSMPLIRAGFAAIALGTGLVLLARRRRRSAVKRD